jgi:hypothetical protein
MYTLPECSHTFHTTCIVQWFRNGYLSCPLCRTEPDYQAPFTSITDYARKKCAPKKLKTLYSKLKDINKTLRGVNKQKTKLKRKAYSTKEMREYRLCYKTYSNLMRRKYTLHQKMRSVNIAPVTIVVKTKIIPSNQDSTQD